MGGRRRDLDTARWRRLRITVLNRDGRECQLRGERCTGVATEVDHILPHQFGGDDSLDNLRAACKRCNGRAGARQRTGAGFKSTPPTPAPPMTLSLAEPRENRTERHTHRQVPE
jgi:5-methylcytosine-specific restriction endonuclease McrA